MGRLSNRDVDALTLSEYEEALGEGKEWAVESYEVRSWAAMDGSRVRIEDPECGTFEGTWRFFGMTGDDFWLVKIMDDDDELIVGTDPRNFTSVIVIPVGTDSE